jgi:hypothetical protein
MPNLQRFLSWSASCPATDNTALVFDNQIRSGKAVVAKPPGIGTVDTPPV